MKTCGQRHTAIILLWGILCLWILAIPVIPHHHHAGGRICMKNDISTTCCSNQIPNHDAAEHCCCHTGCISTHFFQQTPSSISIPAPYAVPLLVSYAFSPTSFLFEDFAQTPIYDHFPSSEPLYNQYIVRGVGMRAPPVFLA